MRNLIFFTFFVYIYGNPKIEGDLSLWIDEHQVKLFSGKLTKVK